MQRCALLLLLEQAFLPTDLFPQIDDPAPSNAWGGAQPETTGDLPPVASGVDFQKDGFRGALRKGAQVFKGKSDQKADEKTQAAIQRTKKSDAPTTQNETASESQLQPAPSSPTAAPDTAVAPPAPAAATTSGDYHPSQTVQQAESAVEKKLEHQPEDSSTSAAAKEQAKEQAKGLSSRLSWRYKERTATVTDRTKQFFNEEFPQDRRDQFIWRMKKVRRKL